MEEKKLNDLAEAAVQKASKPEALAAELKDEALDDVAGGIMEKWTPAMENKFKG